MQGQGMGDYGIWYCSRESVKQALFEAETARSNTQVDDAIEQGARDAESLCHLPPGDSFAPTLATRYFDYPSRTGRPPTWRVWLSPHRLLSLTSLTSEGGATTLTAGQYNLEPANFGPPYNRIEINLGSSGAFGAGDTHQRAIAATGLWGETLAQRSIGSLSGTLGATATATASLAWTTARFGVGDILLIDSERMVIRERTFVDSTQNLGTALIASEADTTVAVSDGTAFAVEEILLLGSERMRVVDIAGNNLTVKRAWDGSQLAAHSSTPTTDVYALTGVELERAALGTTIAAHAADAVVYRWLPPGMLATLNRAYAITALMSERTGWARTVQASADTVIELTGRGIKKLEDDVMRRHGRFMRTRAIVGGS